VVVVVALMAGAKQKIDTLDTLDTLTAAGTLVGIGFAADHCEEYYRSVKHKDVAASRLPAEPGAPALQAPME
jgi:hypothetical protein